MPENRVEDDGELQVVKAAEPFEVFFRREFPKMVAVAYAVSGSRWAAEELAQEAFFAGPSVVGDNLRLRQAGCLAASGDDQPGELIPADTGQ